MRGAGNFTWGTLFLSVVSASRKHHVPLIDMNPGTQARSPVLGRLQAPVTFATDSGRVTGNPEVRVEKPTSRYRSTYPNLDHFRFADHARSNLAQHSERNGDLSPSVARPARISPVTRERWARIGITAQFLIVVRTLGEFFRLRHVLGTSFSAAVAAPYVGGALIAACFCWAGVTLYFFRRYTLSVWIALAAVVILLVYKIAVIGW